MANSSDKANNRGTRRKYIWFLISLTRSTELRNLKKSSRSPKSLREILDLVFLLFDVLKSDSSVIMFLWCIQATPQLLTLLCAPLSTVLNRSDSQLYLWTMCTCQVVVAWYVELNQWRIICIECKMKCETSREQPQNAQKSQKIQHVQAI